MENLGFKGVLECIDKDSPLAGKYNVDEFLANKIAPGNSDMSVEEAYEGFCKFIGERKVVNGKSVI